MEARRRYRAKMNIPMCVACVLLCLTLFTTHLMSGLYAKYTVTGTGGDGARVATFGDVAIVETGDMVDGQWIATPGVHIEKDAKVVYTGSEVATYIFLEVDVSSNWEVVEARNFKIKNESTETEDLMNFYLNASNWSYIENTDYVYCYTYTDSESNTTTSIVKPNMSVEAGIILPNGQYDGKHIIVGSAITEENFASVMNDTYIKFKATVVQAGGFENAEKAWESVKDK